MSAFSVFRTILKALFILAIFSAFVGSLSLFLYHGGTLKLPVKMERKLPDIMLYDAAYLKEMKQPPPKPKQAKEKKHKFGLF